MRAERNAEQPELARPTSMKYCQPSAGARGGRTARRCSACSHRRCHVLPHRAYTRVAMVGD